MHIRLKKFPTTVETEYFPMKHTRRMPCEHWQHFPLKRNYSETAEEFSNRDDLCKECLKQINYKPKHPAPNSVPTPSPNLHYQHETYIHRYLSREFSVPDGNNNEIKKQNI